MIVTYIYANVLTDQIRVQMRCRNLVDAINRTGYHRAHLLDMNSFIENTPYARRVCNESDLLVIYRYLHGPILTAIQYWKARDKKVIVDFDQAIDHMTPDNPSWSFWYEGTPLAGLNLDAEPRIEPAPIEQFKWGLTLVDAATVPSARIAEDWSQYTKFYTVYDYINTYQYPLLDGLHEKEIWIGLGNRVSYGSLEQSGLLSAVENVCQMRSDVKFVYCLDPGSRKPDVRASQLVTYAPRYFEEWVTILLSLNLGLIPAFTEYDLRLGFSDMLEFMVAKIPWLASQDLGFYKMSSYGKWVSNTPAAWENAILGAIDQLGMHQRRALGDPFLFAISQDIGANIDSVLNIYSAILRR